MSVRVRFLKTHGLWNKGEVAGFTADRADDLIKAGVAEDAAAAGRRAEAQAAADAEAQAAAEAEAQADADAKAKADVDAKAKADADAKAKAGGK